MLSFLTFPPDGGEVRNRVPLWRDELTEGNLQLKQTVSWRKKNTHYMYDSRYSY
jgi:hypothetical protein